MMKQQDLHLISFPCSSLSSFQRNGFVFIVINFNSFSSTGYYYNATGLLACEPFYSKPSYRILASCAFYFPTTMVLMYCYGSSFHANRFRLASATSSSNFTTPAAITEKVNSTKQLSSFIKGFSSHLRKQFCLSIFVFFNYNEIEINHIHLKFSKQIRCCNLIKPSCTIFSVVVLT